MRRYLVVCLALIGIASCGFASDPRPNRPQQTVTVVPKVLIADSKTKTVAVIDTGLAEPILESGYRLGICKFGHKDFTGEGIKDTHGHGTNVSGLIHRGAIGSNYCQVIIKYYSKSASNKENLDRMIAAIKYAVAIRVDYINLSGGGIAPFPEEKAAVDDALKHGIKIIAAAGNEKTDLAKQTYYPAMYDDRIIVVGDGVDEAHKAKTSNYGKRVNIWRDGVNQTAFGITETGTSQATAIYTGELIKADYVKENSHVQHR